MTPDAHHSTPRKNPLMTRSLRLALASLVLAALWFALARGHAQSPPAPLSPLAEAMAFAMREEVAIGRPGHRIPVRHCRRAGPEVPGGDAWARCDRRLRAFAVMFERAAAAHNLDPWLLAAIARQESGYNPHAVGASHREGGLMQLHPANRVNREVPFLASEAFARRCRDVVGACQGPVVERAATILETALNRCADPRSGLNAYNLGRCSSDHDYANRIYDIRARMTNP